MTDRGNERVRSVEELARAVRVVNGTYTLTVTPWEFSAITEHHQALNQHADVWTSDFRQALASRFVAFHRSVRDVPFVKVVIIYDQPASDPPKLAPELRHVGWLFPEGLDGMGAILAGHGLEVTDHIHHAECLPLYVIVPESNETETP